MARYYFHLRDGIDQLLDPEGIECIDLAAVKDRALHTARELIADDARSGLIDLCYRVEVQNSADWVVHTLAFDDAVTIKRGADDVPDRPVEDDGPPKRPRLTIGVN